MSRWLTVRELLAEMRAAGLRTDDIRVVYGFEATRRHWTPHEQYGPQVTVISLGVFGSAEAAEDACRKHAEDAGHALGEFEDWAYIDTNPPYTRRAWAPRDDAPRTGSAWPNSVAATQNHLLTHWEYRVDRLSM